MNTVLFPIAGVNQWEELGIRAKKNKNCIATYKSFYWMQKKYFEDKWKELDAAAILTSYLFMFLLEMHGVQVQGYFFLYFDEISRFSRFVFRWAGLKNVAL